jgi:hypothetical protein
MVLTQNRQYHTEVVQTSRLVDNPDLIDKVKNQGIVLEGIGLGVLNLGKIDAKRLEEAGIITLKQLADANTLDLLNIPHFGKVKVQQLKVALEGYFVTLLNGKNRESDSQTCTPDAAIAELVSSEKQAVPAPSRRKSDLELAAVSKKLDKLKKRLESLESRLARVRKATRPSSNK